MGAMLPHDLGNILYLAVLELVAKGKENKNERAVEKERESGSIILAD